MMSFVKSSIPQFVWWMTNHARVPRSLYEMTSDRMASSLARPPALRITWASPSARPAYLAGSSRASIQVRIAKWRPGGNGKLPLSPNVAAYWAFAASTSSRMLIAFTPCTAFEVVRTCYERQYPSMSMCCQLSVLRVGSVRIGSVVYVCLCGLAVGQLGWTASYHWYEVGVNTSFRSKEWEDHAIIRPSKCSTAVFS